jgi:molybdopterin-containing oxidoreductase family iron-sulfur binding subunit
MAKKKYWQSFGEYNDSEAFQKSNENEFPEELPFQSADEKGLANAPASRRDFLKYLGFSTAAAVAAASCETPIRKAIPYVNKPADMIPGVADYYATTYVCGSEVIPVVAKVRDGRPIKITGNTLCSFTKGGTSTRAQASVLDLYDTARLRHPMANKTAVSFEAVDKMIAGDLAALGGKPVVLLTSTITSPTTKQIISEFLAKYPGSRHVQYDPVSYSGILLANEATYGQRAIPTYQFENAKVVVSIAADFLGTWLNAVEYQRGYGVGRKLKQSAPEMSKHYQFESMLSMTGANADERFTHRPSETGLVAAALLSAVSGQGAGDLAPKLKDGIEKAAADLVANRGKALVVCGSNNPQVQIIVNAINEAIGANGTTINWATPLLTNQSIDADMVKLVSDMESGAIGGLFIYQANPAYEYFDSPKFANALKRVGLTVSFNDRKDETTVLCKYVLPASHYLESWGDAEIKPGYFSLMQPTISPLFDTRQIQDSLLKLAGNETPYHTYFAAYWQGKLGGLDAYNKALQDGIIEPATPPAATTAAFNGAGVEAAKAAMKGLQKTQGLELVVYQKISLGDGKHANNPWLLELPDPITRATWDNYVMIPLSLAKTLSKDTSINLDISKRHIADQYEVHPEKPVIAVSVGGHRLELPVLVIPGMQDNTIAIAVGFGRSKEVGKAVWTPDGTTFGKNAYPLLSFNGTTFDWHAADVSVAVTGREYRVAQTQTHSNREARVEVVRELTFDHYKKNPFSVLEDRKEELKHFGGIEKFREQGTIYPVHDKPGIKWGMSIDLNSCFGCGACVVSCTAENNVAVVGKHEVARFHDMHWLRIDRYFAGDPNDPESIQTIFQPMPCQHCDNAPCENVCPVEATMHNSEGINQMAYNRCIGTRYCANNCPYKVRRFNWADYTGADSFPNNQQPLVDEGSLDEVVLMMNDDLTRMVLNPDVVVRSRGVMEKCSFCVQRLQEGKLKAKRENRVLTDDDVKTACQEACPADAIVFGNVNNSESEISRTRRDNEGRLFYTLETLHTLPNVSYLAKVRNTQILSSDAEEARGEFGSGVAASEPAEH